MGSKIVIQTLGGQVAHAFSPNRAQPLQDLVAVNSIDFKGVTALRKFASLPKQLQASISMSSGKFEVLRMRYDLQTWRAACERHLVRIYPSWQHVDSSNSDPQDAWEAVCQIVALNFQHHSSPELWMNR